MTRVFRSAFLVVILIAAGCRDTERIASPLTEPSAPPDRLASGPPVSDRERESRGEALFAELERHVPGAGGLYMDSAGFLVVVLRDPAHSQRARVAVPALLSRRGIRPPQPWTGRLRVVQGRYTFSELERYRDVIFDEVFTTEERFEVLDLDEVANRVRMEVRGLTAGSGSAIMRQIASFGVDTNAVLLAKAEGRSGPERRLAPPASTSHYADTIVGGLQVGTYWNGASVGACTAGIVVTRNGVPGVVTASHCSATWAYLENTELRQPWDNGRRLGQEIVDPASYMCGWFQQCRASDAALFSLEAGVAYRVGTILNTTPNNGYLGGGMGGRITIVDKPYLTVTRVENNDLLVGFIVHKLGDSTGHTWGDLTNTCEDHNEGTRVTRCVYRAGYFSGGGDSGGPVWMNYSDTWVTLGGVHLGQKNGRGVFSKWSRVVSDLGPLSVIGGSPPSPPPTISVSILGPSGVSPGTSCSWSADVQNAQGDVQYVWTANDERVGSSTPLLTYTNTGSEFTIGISVTADNGASTSQLVVQVASGYACY